MKIERFGVAIHESGHAVVAWLLGFPINFVTITEHEDSAGRLSHQPENRNFTDELRRDEAEATVSLAGPLALEIFLGDLENCGARGDVERMRTLLEPHYAEREKLLDRLEALGHATRTLVHDKLPVIRKLALELMKRETLTGVHVERILSAAGCAFGSLNERMFYPLTSAAIADAVAADDRCALRREQEVTRCRIGITNNKESLTMTFINLSGPDSSESELKASRRTP